MREGAPAMGIGLEGKQNSCPTYFQDESITIQFILVTYLDAARTLHRIEQLLHHDQSQIKEVSRLFQSLHQSPQKDPLNLFHSTGGLIQKMENYLQTLKKAAQNKRLPLSTLQSCLVRMKKRCQTSRELLHKNEDPTEETVNKIKRSQEKISTCSQKVAQELSRLLMKFGAEENLALLMLKKQEEIGTVFGKTFLKEFMEKIYPGGLTEMKSFLLHQYSLRGFEELQPQIIDKVREIEQ